MFWKLSFRRPCAIDTLLEKEDCTLDEILDEDDVLQECKSNNKKLTDFLAKPDILERLVKMVCFEPEEDVEDKVKFKYPHLACELLTSEVFTIVEQLSTSESLLNMLWDFLDNSNALNPLLASFVSKVLSMLLAKEPNVIVNYIKAKEEFIAKFLNHLGTSAIMDFLLQMVAAPPTDSIRMGLALWLKEEGIVERLVDFIKDSEDHTDGDQCVNSSLALCEMIRISRETYQLSNPAPLHDILESKDIIERLLSNMFSVESPSDVVIVNGVGVLLTILRESPPPMEFGVVPSMSDSVMAETTPSPGIANVLEVIVPSLKHFQTLLTRKPEFQRMNTTVGVLDPPLGNMRLQVVKLISALMLRNSPTVAREVVQLDMFNTIVDLFFAFPWNNFLHMQVEMCVQAVLDCPHPPFSGHTREEGEGEDTGKSALLVNGEADLKSLRAHLLKECQLVSKILDGAATNETVSSRQSGRRQGYMGHLVRISNKLVTFGETDEQLKSSLDEEMQQRWNNFVNGPLADMNKKNETNLGGNQPLTSNMDDSDEEFDQLGSSVGDSELEKAYQQYLDVKYTGSYLDEYGVEDELAASEEPFEASFTRLMDITRMITADEQQPQPTSMFEAVCSDRIQQFDDDESDDEEDDDEDSGSWTEKDANLSSPMDHHNNSASSDEDDFGSRREFPTGDSHDDKRGHSDLRPQGRAAAYLKNSPNIITQITSTTSATNDPDKMEIENSFGGVLSWKSDLTSDEDLSGVIPMDTGPVDWTKEPDHQSSDKLVQSQGSMWADFSKFPSSYGSAEGARTAQGLHDEPSVTPSHITVTYITRDMHNASGDNDDEDFLEPSERPDTSKYSVMTAYDSPNPRRDLDPEAIEVAYHGGLDDSRSSESEEDDINSSSDSDEDRSGHYDVNTSRGSDTQELLNSSLNDSRELEVATSLSSSPSSSSGHDHHPPTSPNGKAAVTTPPDTSSHSSRHNVVVDGKVGGVKGDQKVPVDGEAVEEDLQDNYSFLAKGLLSGGKVKENSQEHSADPRSPLEKKRAEALEACNTYDNEVKTTATLQQGSVET